MTSDRKKPGVAFWATVVLVVVLVGCPLSWGPALYFHIKLGQPSYLESIVDGAYAPLDWALDCGPEWLCETDLEYGAWWIELAGGLK